MTERPPNAIQSAERTLEILETIKRRNRAGVSELATELDLPKSTVHNYLRTLEREEYLVKENGTYRLGLRVLGFGEQVKDELEILRIAKPELEDLAESTGELASLMVEEHGRGIYIHLHSGDKAVYLDARAGLRTYLHQTGLGKSLLASLPDERVEEIIDRHGLPKATENTITDRDELFEELREVEERGYAIDNGERVEAMRCVATAIQPDGQEPRGAISVSGPSSRMQGEFFETTLPNAVQETASVIEINLRFS